jgi:hypothetical protein
MYDGKSAAEEIKILLNNSRKKARESENKIKLKNFDKLLKDFQDLNDIFKELTGQNLNKETLQIEITNLKNEIEKLKLKNINNSGYENNNNYSRY